MTSRGLLLAGTCFVGLFKLIGEIVAALLIERCGTKQGWGAGGVVNVRKKGGQRTELSSQ